MSSPIEKDLILVLFKAHGDGYTSDNKHVWFSLITSKQLTRLTCVKHILIKKCTETVEHMSYGVPVTFRVMSHKYHELLIAEKEFFDTLDIKIKDFVTSELYITSGERHHSIPFYPTVKAGELEVAHELRIKLGEGSKDSLLSKAKKDKKVIIDIICDIASDSYPDDHLIYKDPTVFAESLLDRIQHHVSTSWAYTT